MYPSLHMYEFVIISNTLYITLIVANIYYALV